MGVTLKDVAARAGVAVSTVSLVLSPDRARPVGPETEARVRAAVRALGYRPNLTARALVNGAAAAVDRTHHIGVVLGATSMKFSHPFYSRIIEGIDAELLAAQRRLEFVYSVTDLADERLWSEMVRPEVVGGLIAVGVASPAVLQHLSATGVAPLVAVEGVEPPEMMAARDVDFVSCDKEQSIAQLMEHLWSLGHRRFAYFGPRETIRDRYVRAWLTQAGAPAPTVYEAAFSPEATDEMAGGYASMTALLATPRDTWPSAIVAASDNIAVGTLRAAHEAGVRVPDDLSLVGFDDSMGGYSYPPLTTIRVDREHLGRVAVRRLLERQRHPHEAAMRLVDAAHLVVRASTAPLPGSSPASGADDSD